MSLLQNSNAVTPVSGYNINNSCRFNNPGITDGSPGTSRLTKTMGTPTNARVWTMSLWCKRAYLGSDYATTGVGPTSGKRFFGAKPTSGATAHSTGFEEDNNLVFRYFDAADVNYQLKSTARYRDVGAWYHCVFQMNTPHATSTERMKIWVNGEQITSFATANYPPQNNLPGWNESGFISAVGTYIGNPNTPTYEYGFDGLLAEIHFVDGQALTAASFGETDEDTNQWKAIKYEGTYGDNGFFFEFENSAALGTDTSGNGNDWTPGDLAATDQMIDTPQNTNGGNFCTMNSLAQLPLATANTFSLQEGNLKCDASSGGQETTGTMMPNSGKWYWELLLQNLASNVEQFGITRTTAALGSTYLQGVNYRTDGDKFIEGTDTTYGATWTTGDVMAAAVDLDANTIIFYKNNVSQGSLSFTTGYDMTPMIRMGANNNLVVLNFGQDSSFAGAETAQNNSDGNGNGDFYYTPPSGYLALCSDNLADPSITFPAEHFNTVLYTGTGVNPHAITGVGFQPDLVWTKARTKGAGNGGNHWLTDVLRGVTKEIKADGPEVEGTDLNGVVAFGADGFSVGLGGFNYLNDLFIGWNWKAGGAGVANTTGSIDSTVSANATAGFSIVTYTGEDNAGDTVGHGLAQAPDMIIVKDLTSPEDWQGYDVTGGPTKYIQLNDTGPYATDTTRWNDTAPTATVFSLGTSDKVNDAGDDYVAYCFHSIEGYSKVGTYKGNGDTGGDGPFIFTDFSPAYVLIKRTDAAASWAILNNKSPGYNVINNSLYANDANAETTGAGVTSSIVDFVSNGIKVRGYSSNVNNASGTYIYLAFAESPFKYSRAR